MPPIILGSLQRMKMPLLASSSTQISAWIWKSAVLVLGDEKTAFAGVGLHGAFGNTPVRITDGVEILHVLAVQQRDPTARIGLREDGLRNTERPDTNREHARSDDRLFLHDRCLPKFRVIRNW
jgi:hypothetical protein